MYKASENVWGAKEQFLENKNSQKYKRKRNDVGRRYIDGQEKGAEEKGAGRRENENISKWINTVRRMYIM
jgi:hypothetical protein